MSLLDAFKPQAQTVMGIDASTKSLAWAIFDGDKPMNCGQIFFNGATVFERLKDAKRKTRALVRSGQLRADFIIMEAAVRVNSIKTYGDLAMVYGAILAELMELNSQVITYPAVSWQKSIGNPPFSKLEKEAVYKEFPDKSKSWYLNKIRQLRKQRTLTIARQHFNIPTDSDDIGDAVGLALHGRKMVR